MLFNFSSCNSKWSRQQPCRMHTVFIESEHYGSSNFSLDNSWSKDCVQSVCLHEAIHTMPLEFPSSWTRKWLRCWNNFIMLQCYQEADPGSLCQATFANYPVGKRPFLGIASSCCLPMGFTSSKKIYHVLKRCHVYFITFWVVLIFLKSGTYNGFLWKSWPSVGIGQGWRPGLLAGLWI